MQNKQVFLFLRKTAVLGNLILILWIVFNGIQSGFLGTLVEKVSYLVLICLLGLNAYLLWRKN